MLFVFLSISLLFSCKKNKKGEVVISGTVTDAVDGTLIGGATINLYYRPLQNGVYSTNYSLYATTTANASGFYSFKVNKPVSSDFKFSASSPACFTTEIIKNPDGISTKNDNKINFSLYSSCTIQLRLFNNAPLNSLDNIDFKFLGINFSCTSCCNNTSQVYSGTSVDVTTNCNRYAKSYLRYQYIVTKGSGSNLFYDSVYCPKGAIVPINILY